MGKKTRGLLFLLALFSMLLSLAPAVEAGQEPPLPKIFIPKPPDVLLIPGSYAYFVPDVDADIVFYGGGWYRLHHGRWYAGNGYNGPWAVIVVGGVPGALMNLPPGFRHTPPGHTRIPHGQLKKNWRQWQDNRHWDKTEKKRFKEERKKDRGHGAKPEAGPGGHGRGRGK